MKAFEYYGGLEVEVQRVEHGSRVLVGLGRLVHHLGSPYHVVRHRSF